jgi:hypothetical protein
MVSITQGGFQVAQQGVIPVKAGHVGAAARRSNHLGLMLAIRGSDGGKTGQTIRDHGTQLLQMLFGPCTDRLRAKALDPIKTHAHRTTRDSDLDCRTMKGTLFSEPRPRLPRR